MRPAGDVGSGRAILLEIHTAPAALWGVLDLSGYTRTLVTMDRSPWRAITITAIAGWVVVALQGPTWMLVAALTGGAAVCILEMKNRRTFLTPRSIVLQSGILGLRRREMLLAEVERVEYSYPRFGERFNAGDVEVVGVRSGLTLMGVSAPEQVADAILRAKQAFGARGRARR